MLIGDLDVPVGTLTVGGGVLVRPLTTLAGAAKVMTESLIGLLLVGDFADDVQGVISERDIVRAVASDADVTEERVRDWMTDDLLTVAATTSVRDAAYALLQAEVRHLVVTDGDRPAGVISERDVLAAAMASDEEAKGSLLG